MSNNELIDDILEFIEDNKYTELEPMWLFSSGMVIDSEELKRHLQALKTEE